MSPSQAQQPRATAPPRYKLAPAPPRDRRAPAPSGYRRAPAPPRDRRAPAPPRYKLAPAPSRDRRPPAPPRYKLALLTWAGAYTVITAILAVLGPTMAAWPLPLRTLLLSVMMVTALTWVVIPSLTRLFRDWLAGGEVQRSCA
jgi:hypothetical protein